MLNSSLSRVRPSDKGRCVWSGGRVLRDILSVRFQGKSSSSCSTDSFDLQCVCGQRHQLQQQSEVVVIFGQCYMWLWLSEWVLRCICWKPLTLPALSLISVILLLRLHRPVFSMASTCNLFIWESCRGTSDFLLGPAAKPLHVRTLKRHVSD